METKTTRTWWRAITLTFSLSLSFAASANALEMDEFTRKSHQSSSQTTDVAQRPANQLQLAQGAGSCYEMIQEEGTYIQEEPTVYSQVLAPIYYGQEVAVASGGTEYWTYISEPISGYVWANWLAPCQTVSQVPPGGVGLDSCRLVSAEASIPVWLGPAESGLISGYIADGQTVTIENLGSDGWVPISEPASGFIEAENLTYCR